jgi:hypothetical protein
MPGRVWHDRAAKILGQLLLVKGWYLEGIIRILAGAVTRLAGTAAQLASPPPIS